MLETTPSDKTIFDVAVIGGGAAGTMATLRSVLYGMKVVWFTGNISTRRKSTAQWVSSVENIPSFFNTKMPITMQQNEVLKWISEHSEFSSNLKTYKTTVDSINNITADSIHHGKTSQSSQLNYFEILATEKNRRTSSIESLNLKARFIVVATGIMPIQPHIKGSIKSVLPFANYNHFIYSLESNGHLTIGKRVLVIGYNKSAYDTIISIINRYKPPFIALSTNGIQMNLSNEQLISLEEKKIPIFKEEILSIKGEPQKGIDSILFDSGVDLKIEKIVVSIGNIIHNDLLKNLNIQLDDDGYVVTDANGRTSLNNVYAAGDIISKSRKQVFSAWDSSARAVDDIEIKIRN